MAIKQKQIPSTTKCPRNEAIKALSHIIGQLKEQNHAIILAVDADQTPLECSTSNRIKQHSIEWLRMEHSLDDPFILLNKDRLTSTTTTPF